MQDEYRVKGKVIKDVLSNLIDSKQLGHQKNAEHIVNYLMNLQEADVEMLLSISTMKNTFPILEVSSIVMFIPTKYSGLYDFDILKDKGLMNSDGYMYGTILSDGDWRSEFNPYYKSMKLNAFTWDKSKVVTVEDTISTLDIIEIDPSDLPDFSNIEIPEFFEEEEVTEVKK
jgi:hypothetical protein